MLLQMVEVSLAFPRDRDTLDRDTDSMEGQPRAAHRAIAHRATEVPAGAILAHGFSMIP